VRVNGGTNYDLPGQRWVPKLGKTMIKEEQVCFTMLPFKPFLYEKACWSDLKVTVVLLIWIEGPQEIISL